MQRSYLEIKGESTPSGDAFRDDFISVRENGFLELGGRQLLAVELDHHAAVADLAQEIKQYRAFDHFYFFTVMKYFHEALLLPVIIRYTLHTPHALSSRQ